VFERIRIEEAARRLEGVVERTPLVAFDVPEARIELRLKLECQQVTGSFKARGAWNTVSQLDELQRRAGVVATSSGNHGRALSWAAGRAGVGATIFMPADAYPNKIEACRELGAEVVLCATREAAEEACEARVHAGSVLVHPYDAERTIEGAGTAGLEVADQWPEVEVLLVPVGGGGLISGCALAMEGRGAVRIWGAEPQGAATLSAALAEGRPVVLPEMETCVQGLCPLSLGELNTAIVSRLVEGALCLADEAILDAQRTLVRQGALVVEPAGAAAVAAVLAGALPSGLLDGRDAADPLRVVAVISGGNPDPAQLEALR